MNINFLKKAIESYMLDTNTAAADVKEAASLLQEIAATKERYNDIECWQGGVSLITDSTLDNVLNELSYDIYGRLARIHGENTAFQYYAYDCRKSPCMEQMTDEQLEFGYEIVSSLWADNEEIEANSADGTFCEPNAGPVYKILDCEGGMNAAVVNEFASHIEYYARMGGIEDCEVTISVGDKKLIAYNDAALLQGLYTAVCDFYDNLV